MGKESGGSRGGKAFAGRRGLDERQGEEIRSGDNRIVHGAGAIEHGRKGEEYRDSEPKQQASDAKHRGKARKHTRNGGKHGRTDREHGSDESVVYGVSWAWESDYKQSHRLARRSDHGRRVCHVLFHKEHRGDDSNV